jgi:superfamily I DNA/RNA helicase
MAYKREEKNIEVITYIEFIFIVTFFIFVLIVLFHPKEILKKSILNEKSNYRLTVAYLEAFIKNSPSDEYLLYDLAQRVIKIRNMDLAVKLLALLSNSKDPELRKKSILLAYKINKLIYASADDEKIKRTYKKKAIEDLKRIFQDEVYKKDVDKWYSEAIFFDQKELELKALKLLYEKMKNKEIPATHSFYLKEFQLALYKGDIKLKYDFVLLDEAQDTNPVTISIFDLINADKKVIVGDTHQQIYAFRGAVDALEKFNGDKYYLTNSFRFNEMIGNIAIFFLRVWKNEQNDKRYC